MPLPIIPSARVVLRQALLAQAALTSTAIGTDVFFAVPGNPSWPILVLHVIDEIELRPETNACRVQVNVWGSGDAPDDAVEAEGLAAVLQSLSRDCDGVWAAGKINNCRAPNRLPSPDPSGRVRVIVDFELEVNQ